MIGQYMYDPEDKQKNIAFLVKAGRRDRLNETKLYPTEFFYGFSQLAAMGLQVSLIEDSEVGMAPPQGWMLRTVGKFSKIFWGLPVGIVSSLIVGRHYRRLNNYDCVIATTNGMALALAITKFLGILKSEIYILAMGIIPSSSNNCRNIIYRKLLRGNKLICISRAEVEYLHKILPDQFICYVPFGVDHNFWRPETYHLSWREDYVLAIGNDLARDWETLTNAWLPSFPKLKIVTSLAVPTAGKNIEVMPGDWRTRLLSDETILKLFNMARFVVVPLHDTIQPAGQSVCLQAMACGKAVVLSDTIGLWDRELIINGYNVVLVPPNDATSLSSVIENLLKDNNFRTKLEKKALQTVSENFNVDLMAKALLAVLRNNN